MHCFFYFYTTVTTYYYSTQEIFMLAWPTGTCVVYGTYSRYTTYITLWSCHCCVIVLLPQGPAKVRCVSNGDLKKNCELVLINSYNEKNNVLLFQKATENSFKICHIFPKNCSDPYYPQMFSAYKYFCWNEMSHMMLFFLGKKSWSYKKMNLNL